VSDEQRDASLVHWQLNVRPPLGRALRRRLDRRTSPPPLEQGLTEGTASNAAGMIMIVVS